MRMEELNKTITTGCKPWKKVLSVLLSIIIAFGTFVTITFGNSRFQKWLGIRDMLSAYAAEMVDTKGAIAVAAGAISGAAGIAAGYVSLVSTRLNAHNKGCNLTLRLYTKGIKKGTFKVIER